MLKNGGLNSGYCFSHDAHAAQKVLGTVRRETFYDHGHATEFLAPKNAIAGHQLPPMVLHNYYNLQQPMASHRSGKPVVLPWLLASPPLLC